MFYNGVDILSKTGFGHSGDDDAVLLKQFQSDKLVKPVESPLFSGIEWSIKEVKNTFNISLHHAT